MRRDEQIHRLSMAIEAMEQCRERLRLAHKGGEMHAEALIAVVSAQVQVQMVLAEMVGEEVDAA